MQLCYILSSFSLHLIAASELKKRKKKNPNFSYKSRKVFKGEKLLTRTKIFLNFVSLSLKRLCKGLSIEYTENNVIISNKSPVIFEREGREMEATKY